MVRTLKNSVCKEINTARKGTLESSNSDLGFTSGEPGKKLHSKHTLCIYFILQGITVTKVLMRCEPS